MPLIFFSHADENKDIALRLATKIGSRGIQTFLDAENILGGSSWREDIDDALREAGIVLVMVSSAANRSRYVTYEWAFALGAGVKVIPVFLEATKNLHLRLTTLQRLDLTSPRSRKKWNIVINEIIRAFNESQAESRTARRPRYVRGKEPEIFAEFELVEGIPKKTNNWYEITLTTEGVPPATKRMEYKILDEKFQARDRILVAGRSGVNFEKSIIADGDALIVAQGKNRAGPWRTQTTLFEALRRGHGSNPSAPIKDALEYIRKNPK